MRHRLFYVFPDIKSARKALDDLLLGRIEERHIHFLTNGESLPSDMPEANFLQRTDVVHGAESGMLVGAGLGMALGLWLVYFPFSDVSSKAAIMLFTTLCGIFFGGWASSMVAAALPNSRLKAFYAELERGKVLMMVDVPARKIVQIENLMAERHPEMRFGGEDPHIPIFP